MYIPKSFEMGETESILQFIRENSFGILFSQIDGQSNATHLPFLAEMSEDGAITLIGHFAKANPHWKGLNGKEVLVVFQGPHAYISPSWYVEKQAVPTWNYVAAHIHGTCSILHEAADLHALLRRMVHFYEPDAPLLAHLDEPFYRQMENAVVGFEIKAKLIEGKSKLSQNKSADSVRGVIDGLSRSTNSMARDVAKLMSRALNSSEEG